MYGQQLGVGGAGALAATGLDLSLFVVAVLMIAVGALALWRVSPRRQM